MNKEEINVDVRTKQDLLFEVSSLGSKLSDEIVKNENLQQENKELKEQLLVTQTNEETFRLEMKDITQTLGLDEDTIFDDVKAYVKSLEIKNQKYKEVIEKIFNYLEDNYGYSCVKGIINDTDVSKLYDILKEVE